jgi:transmembrane sensor
MRAPPDPSSAAPAPDDVEAQASLWLARRDRGLTAAEQDAYLQWLREDARHHAAIVRLDAAWGELDQLAEWRPAHSARPNPDLLAVPRRRRWSWVAGLAAAAALVFGFIAVKPVFEGAPSTRVVRHSEVRTLADGSIVELNKGAEIDVDFSGPERHIRLLRGEAHFTVAKLGAEHPFIVTVGNLRVRAVGTVFNVRLAGGQVDVLVTEGKVRIDPPKPADLEMIVNASMVGAGERTMANATEPTPVPPAVVAASDAEIEQALAWQGLRLEFAETPLADAVEEFNRHSGTRFVIADETIARLRIDGNFRADNAEAFARFLPGFGINVDRDHGGRYVLRADPARP